ncbi:GNAT family N-acetyltransferase [Paenibacillus sp. 19GGS1-52]|uniref:GNAT family N-acetyltransferase n=1 Tax=Paenibacillus sp. 19GGS1-52 TaxID=2758563 RepID=UPI001EFB3BC2|nr:GNAT family N-acetyltransferase [Paenibacillus sp. 19GGS1-52]ULO06403.1 GNAT family N-acetyltransferase [Paenibacillus sp. 19GGS1-52]
MMNLKDFSDFSAVKNLLSECMWPDEERVNAEATKYLKEESRELYGSFIKNELVGLIGIKHGSFGEVELKHIAIHQEYRGKGLGRKLVHEYIRVNNIVKMKAETDCNAEGFYKKLGFKIMSLGEKYPGVERFECTFSGEND